MSDNIIKFSDTSLASDVIKTERVLDGIIKGSITYFFDDGFPKTAILENDLKAVSKFIKENINDNSNKTELSFSEAFEYLEKGKKITRKGWNGKDMWLSISCHEKKSIPSTSFWSKNNANFAIEQGGEATVLPCITMKTALNEIQMGWVPSQQDMFSKDWIILD